MVLEPGRRRGRERLKLHDELRRGVARGPPAFARDRLQPGMQARQVPTGLAALVQQRGGEQAAEPGRVLQRRDGVPGLRGDRRRQRRRQRAGLLDHGAPVAEPCVLVPVGIVDQRIPPQMGAALAGECSVGFRDRGVDHGEGGGEVRVGLDDVERRVEIRLLLVPVLIVAHHASFAFLPVALPAPAAQAGEAGRRQRPVGFGIGDAAAGAQHGMRPGELMGRGADVHVGVVEHEVVEVDQFAVEPQAGRGVGEVGANDKTGPDRALGEPLVEARQRIFRCGF